MYLSWSQSWPSCQSWSQSLLTPTDQSIPEPEVELWLIDLWLTELFLMFPPPARLSDADYPASPRPVKPSVPLCHPGPSFYQLHLGLHLTRLLLSWSPRLCPDCLPRLRPGSSLCRLCRVLPPPASLGSRPPSARQHPPPRLPPFVVSSRFPALFSFGF